jgi:hypothetical protein
MLESRAPERNASDPGLGLALVVQHVGRPSSKELERAHRTGFKRASRTKYKRTYWTTFFSTEQS